MLFINSNPNRQTRTQQWSFIKYNYDALICFPDVTLLNLFPSQNRLLVVPIRGEEKAIFTWRIPDMHGSLESPIFSKFNRKWKLLLDKDRKNLQVHFVQGVDPISLQDNCFELVFYDWGNMWIWMKIESENM